MKRKTYITPCIMQVEWNFEAFCLTSSAEFGTEIEFEIEPEPWKEGNTNWW